MIKLGAEFDGRSLSTASGDIARAIAEGVKTGVSDGLKGAFGGADFTVAASRFADSLNGAISKIDFGKSLNIGDALAGTNSVLTELTGQLDGVRKAIEQTVSSFNDIGRRGADGIDTIIASMRELNNLVQQINSKSFNVVNQFSVDGFKSASDGITLYRNQARALIDTLDEMYNAMMNSSAAGKIAIDAWKKLSGDGGMNLKSMRSVVDNDNTSLTKLQMLINSGERFKAIMEELISVEQRFDSSLALPDTTKFDAATQKIAEFEAQNARAEAAVTAAAEATVKASEKMAAATQALDSTPSGGAISGASAEKEAQANAVAKAENAEAAAAKETIKAEREATDVALEAAYAKEEKAKAAHEVEQAERAEAEAAKAIAKASASATKNAEKALSDVEVANKKVVSSQEKAVTSVYEKLEKQMGGDSRFAEITEAYKKYEEAVAGIKRGPVSDDDVAKVTALRNALMEQVQALENSAKAHDQNSEAAKKDAEITEAQVAVVRKQAANLNRQITEQLRRIPGLDDSEFGARLKEIQAELSGKDIDPTRLKELSAEVAEIKDGYTQAGYAGTGFFTTLSSGLRNIAGFTAMVAGLRKVISVIKQMTAAIKEVDAAMTELRKVTSMTAAGYDDFLKRAGAAAKQIGATVSDTVNASADFARLGYDPDEALELAQAALVYKNVGDGIEDVSQATESLISTIKAFRLEASDATMVIDEFNEVGNRFAISSTGIGEALVRSASALQGAGNSLEESIGLITAANAIVQNPESVGGMMRPAA